MFCRYQILETSEYPDWISVENLKELDLQKWQWTINYHLNKRKHCYWKITNSLYRNTLRDNLEITVFIEKIHSKYVINEKKGKINYINCIYVFTRFSHPSSSSFWKAIVKSLKKVFWSLAYKSTYTLKSGSSISTRSDGSIINFPDGSKENKIVEELSVENKTFNKLIDNTY